MGNPEKTAQKVSLLSYNLYCLPWLACLMKPSTCPLSFERTSAFLKHIPQYDIIGLQEVWSPRYQQVASFAKSQGLHVVGSATASLRSMMGLRVFGGGLMIISKYPIETTRELVFDKGVASDGFVTKGVLYAKVRVGSSYVHVFNTHMQASYGYEFAENDPYSLIRKKQIQQVSNFIAKIALLEDDGYPIIAMGDFNVNAIRRPYETSSPTCELSKLESSREYQDMVQTLAGNGLFEVVDLHREYNGGVHPVTNAGKGVKKGMKESKGGQRLDFMFELRRNITRRDRIFHSIVYCNVIPFEVEGEMYTHISDHFASHAVMEMEHREWRKVRKEREEGEEQEEKDGAEREVRRVSNKMTVQLSFE